MPRRVVTGRDGSGKSVFVSDGEVPADVMSATPDNAFFNVWGADGRTGAERRLQA